MSDMLLEVSRHKLARTLLKRLPLPIPMPEVLPRQHGPSRPDELAGRRIAIGGPRDGILLQDLCHLVRLAGGDAVESLEPDAALNGMIFDATTLGRPDQLGLLYDFIKPRLRALKACGRILLLGAAVEDCPSPAAAATQAALTGFTRSLSKELGRRGGTCVLLQVPAEARNAPHLIAPVTFLLSGRASYIAGQVIPMTAGVMPPADRPREHQFAGRTALVTGASRGIGAAICRRLAADGATIIGLDHPREREALAALMQELRGSALPLDLLALVEPAVAAQLTAHVRAFAGEHGALDIVVHNAGIVRDKTLARMPRDWWDDTVAVNLEAPLRLTDQILGQGLLRDHGRIICMSSIAGLAGNAGQTNYAAAKAGLSGYVGRLAPLNVDRGVTVNAVAPGFIETKMTESLPFAVREVGRRLNALSQSGLPEDVAEAVAFLAGPAAFGFNGVTLRVCGHHLIGA